MKVHSSLLATLLLLGATTLCAQAQTKVAPRRAVQPKAKVVPVGITMKDGFMMKEGKVMMTRDAHTETLTSETALLNGTKINADGTVTMTDGTTAMLKEGDYMSLTGRLTTKAMKAEQDSLLQVARDGGKSKAKMKKKVK
ncbi:DUF6799 domain-containing protein [Hymenobacter tenuis]